MCFAAAGKAIFGHPEVAVGLVPGGGATQRLPRLIGRGRALEVLLGCNDLSAELAERYGYVNRALPADELTPFVEKLARRIASFPAHAIAHAKAAVDNGAFGSLAEALLVEAHESDLSVANEATQARVAEALKAGAETYEGELEIDYLSRLSPAQPLRDSGSPFETVRLSRLTVKDERYENSCRSVRGNPRGGRGQADLWHRRRQLKRPDGCDTPARADRVGARAP
jgi:hypothetical protein